MTGGIAEQLVHVNILLAQVASLQAALQELQEEHQQLLADQDKRARVLEQEWTDKMVKMEIDYKSRLAAQSAGAGFRLQQRLTHEIKEMEDKHKKEMEKTKVGVDTCVCACT